MSDLVQTSHRTRIHRDTECLLFTIDNLLDTQDFVEVTCIVIGRNASANIYGSVLAGCDGINGKEPDTRVLGIISPRTVVVLRTVEVALFCHIAIQELLYR